MKETILLIEDEIELQQNLKEILEYNGFALLTADNGLEGLKKLESNAVDLIICDIMMPVMDGYQCIKEVKSQDRLQDIPFIFLSAKASKQDRENGLAKGADDYLTKPISARMLLNAVFALLAKRKLEIQNAPQSGSSEDSSRGMNSPKGSTCDPGSLVQVLERKKKAFESQDWSDLSIHLTHALTIAQRMQDSYKKLFLFKQLDQREIKPSSFSVGDLMLDKINELGAEKFLFRTRVVANICFDREMLDFLLDELLDNALSYSQPRSTVEVEYFGNELTIKNLQAQHLSNVPIHVEAFSGVGSDKGSFENLGLGLFLVQEYCHKNGAKLTHEVNESRYFVVKITFKEL
jgi:two-component system, sensor histidine kinase and response regulator